MLERSIMLSRFINAARKFLLTKGFFEHHLYSTLNYKIENTATFEIEKGRFLRYNPEPDIWTAGERYDKFFWIGSMFRDEPKVSSLHKKEFTVIDTYILGGMNEAVDLFMQIIGEIELELNLSRLSKLPIKYVRHRDFGRGELEDGRYWLVVTDYPIVESFYDLPSEHSADETKKFEIYFVYNKQSIEIAACGNLGENLNKKNFIKNAHKIVNHKVLDKGFVGFGFGIERLIHLYQI